MNVGVLSLVLLSVDEVPVSEAAIRSGADVGADGAAVSIVTVRIPDADDALPAASVAITVMLWTP